MKKINFKKGFTLIELLVVVAIIGILASVVLASLGSARSRSADSAVKANLLSIRTQAEIIYNTVESPTDSIGYDGVCLNTIAYAAFNAAANAGKNGGLCQDSTTAWAAWVGLKGTVTAAWCVDSIGASKQITKPVPAVGYTVCP